MAKKRQTASSGARNLQGRLTALGGLVVIVGGAAAILFFAGVLGGQGGGTTETGREIEDAVFVETAPPAGLEGLEVATKEGALAPDFEVSDMQGDRHRLSDFRGKVVYLNFWATWCIPCQREMPDIQELQDRHKDELVVIAVNRAEPLGRAQDFLRNLEKLNGEPGISFAVNGLDPDDDLYPRYTPFPGAMPVSFFIDAEGKIVGLYPGLISLAKMEEGFATAKASAPLSDEGTTAAPR